jgi:hypothetical protein
MLQAFDWCHGTSLLASIESDATYLLCCKAIQAVQMGFDLAISIGYRWVELQKIRLTYIPRPYSLNPRANTRSNQINPFLKIIYNKLDTNTLCLCATNWAFPLSWYCLCCTLFPQTPSLCCHHHWPAPPVGLVVILSCHTPLLLHSCAL